MEYYYRMPKWHGQPERVVVMVEKQALQGVFDPICRDWQVDLMVCRGYPSLSQQYELAERLRRTIDDDQELHIVYFGDFDPSGENIPEKMEERLSHDFGVSFASFDKVALTYDQVMEWELPPAPAKRTDSRTVGFVDKYGVGMQVELDAIKPSHLSSMIDFSIARHYDKDIGRRADDRMKDVRRRIRETVGKMNIDVLLEED
jgi:hypothetical protein